LNPDALQIIFGSSSEQATIGSELFVDDVSYTIFPASTNTIAENKKMTVYPNPASDKLYIKSNGDAKTITLYSMDGRQLMSKYFSGNTSLSIASLPQGNYCYTLADDAGAILQRQTITIVR